MATLKIPSLSREYVQVPVTVTGIDAATVRSSTTVQFAFLSDLAAEPATGDWVAGDWTSSGQLAARCLVGPGGTVALANGDYNIWWKVTGAVEAPVRSAGKLRVT